MKDRAFRGVRQRGGSPRVAAAAIAAALVIAATLTCAGCGAGDPRGVRVAVHGEVTLDEKPLEAGAILFHCGEGEDELVAVGYIENGHYEIARRDGPLVGTARVEFQAKPVSQEDFETAMEVAAEGRRPPSIAVVAIPPQYGKDSKETVDVAKDGENKFDFDLKSRP
jgi:hypothetical protein